MTGPIARSMHAVFSNGFGGTIRWCSMHQCSPVWWQPVKSASGTTKRRCERWNRVCLLRHHDDAAREYAYDKGAEESLQLAREHGWTVVSMDEDFATVFP
jgi:hypothetical protein